MRRAGWHAPLLVAVIIVAGCGKSGGEGITTIRTPGNPPVVLVSQPRRTGWHVPSTSMQPTLHCARPFQGCHARDPDRLLMKPYTEVPRRGDIALFNAPTAASEAACNASGIFAKRVIGLPGETLEERNGVIYVDGKELNEPYVQASRRDHQSGAWEVPEGHYFFTGDNRQESCDSRRYGSIALKDIVGKVVTVYRLR